MSRNLCVFGEVLFDVFPDGQQVLGGAPFNVAWHLQAFAQQPKFISRIGSDAQGKAIRQAMSGWGMDTRLLQQDDALPTGTVSIQFDDGEPVYDIVSPSAWDAIDIPSPRLSDCDLLYHGSLALRHDRSATTLQHLLNARPTCVFMDVNLRDPWWDRDSLLSLLHPAHWVKLNIDEFDLLYPGRDRVQQRLAMFIRDYHLQGVILTHGASGAEVLQADAGHFSVQPEKDIEVVDTVGAGDAFTSIIILGLVNEWPMQATLQRAQQFASSIVGRRGATVRDADFYHHMLSSWS